MLDGVIEYTQNKSHVAVDSSIKCIVIEINSINSKLCRECSIKEKIKKTYSQDAIDGIEILVDT